MARRRRSQGGTIRQLPSGRWQVRAFDRATGRHVPVGVFATKQDANVALSRVVVEQSQGAWVAPECGKVRLGQYADDWLAHHPSLSPRTRGEYERVLRLHIRPQFGDANVGDLTTASIRRWHAELRATQRPSVAPKAYRVLRAILNVAVDDGLIGLNPCRVKGAGIERAAERPIASIAEVMALAEAVDPRYRVLVLMATWTALRFGELAALTRADIDLDRGTVSVSKNRQRLDDGTVVILPPKSAAGHRTVSIPPPLIDELREHVGQYVRPGRDALVFTTKYGYGLDRSNWSAHWRQARERVGRPDLRFHDLRHTGNTLAAATGASTRELMVRMGHSSPRAALIYQHATRERDEAIAAALGRLMTAAPPLTTTS